MNWGLATIIAMLLDAAGCTSAIANHDADADGVHINGGIAGLPPK